MTADDRGAAIPDPEAAPDPEPDLATVEAIVRSIQAREAAAPARRPRSRPETPSTPSRASADAADTPAEAPTRPTAVRVAGRRRSSGQHRRQVSAPSFVSRARWDRLVADEGRRRQRYGRPAAIVVAQLGGLDAVGAALGPTIRARVAPACGETLVTMARESDRVTDLGDGRFAVLLREADEDGARHYAARAIAACDRWLAAMPWPLRLDVTWTAPGAGEDLANGLVRAERRLGSGSHGTKRGGR